MKFPILPSPVLPAGTTVVTGSKAPISALVPAHTAILPVSDMRFRAIYPRGCAAKRSRGARTSTRLTAQRNTSCCHSGLPPDPAPVERALSRLPKQYVHHTGSRWSLTEDGFLISNAVIVSVLEEI